MIDEDSQFPAAPWDGHAGNDDANIPQDDEQAVLEALAAADREISGLYDLLLEQERLL